MKHKLKKIFGFKMAPLAQSMGIPVRWLKDCLHEMLESVNYQMRSRDSDEVVHASLSSIYPGGLAEVLIMYLTPEELLSHARHWQAIPSKVDLISTSGEALSQVERQRMVDMGYPAFGCFAIQAWRMGLYQPCRYDLEELESWES